MHALIDFWKKDFINKLIVVLLLALCISGAVIAYMLANIPRDSLFYAYLLPTEGPSQTPAATLTPTVTAPALPTLDPGSLSTTTIESPVVTEPPVLPEQVVETVTSEATISLLTPTLPLESPALSATPTLDVDVIESKACIPDTPAIPARVVEILDGNTIRAYFDGKVYTVRYIGVEPPDAKNVYNQAATLKNSDLVYAKDILMVPGATDTDSRGRLMRYVLVGDTFVNYELLRLGLASAPAELSDPACADVFQRAEENAIAQKTGMWSLGTPPSTSDTATPQGESE